MDREVKKISIKFDSELSEESFENYKRLQQREVKLGPEGIKKSLGLKRKPRSLVFKGPKEDGRIYPGYFAPIIVMEGGQRVIKTMRYRVRPAKSLEEIPSKYNVFNARIDALEKRRTWQGIFMKNHGLFPFVKFYEWVEDKSSKKRLINFMPSERDVMWAPVVYDYWESVDKEIGFNSFALLTDDPPPEVAEQGHDRCPIFLKKECIDDWLTPNKKSKLEVYKILSQVENVYFNHNYVN